jgi:Na+-translocating ferredoxin:NAD+ oxidoreductase RnfD subunit
MTQPIALPGLAPGPLAGTARRPAPAPSIATAPPRGPGRLRRLAAAAELRDPRLYQIGSLGGLLAFGVLRLDLEVRGLHAALILLTVLATQYAGGRLAGLPRFDPRSALISGLSLCLLLRTSAPGLAVLAAAVAIGSKFLLRVRGKHVFNPTNLALVALIGVTGEIWVSPGQWGSVAFFAFLMACAGGLVVNRASRSDVTCAFIAAYAALVLGRSWWLGDPLAVPLHRLQNGALVLFTFFMISDPRTTPDSRAGRILFAVLVAAGAWYIQFRLFRTNGLLWSLALCSLAVPLIDRLLPGGRYEWRWPPPPGGPSERRQVS